MIPEIGGRQRRERPVRQFPVIDINKEPASLDAEHPGQIEEPVSIDGRDLVPLNEGKEKNTSEKKANIVNALKSKVRVAQKEETEVRPEFKHQQELVSINAQLSELIKLKQENEKGLWGFMPAKRRERAKLEEEIGMLKTKGRVERMHIAELTGEYHRDVKKQKTRKATREALKPFFDEIQNVSESSLKEVQPTDERQIIRDLYKEKVQLQAEREGFSLLLRPFRKRAIDARLEEIGEELKKLQQEVHNIPR